MIDFFLGEMVAGWNLFRFGDVQVGKGVSDKLSQERWRKLSFIIDGSSDALD